MNDAVYLVFDRKRVRGMVRRAAPKLEAGEFCVRLRLNVPDKYFDRAIPTATLDVPLSAIAAGPTAQVELPAESAGGGA